FFYNKTTYVFIHTWRIFLPVLFSISLLLSSVAVSVAIFVLFLNGRGRINLLSWCNITTSFSFTFHFLIMTHFFANGCFVFCFVIILIVFFFTNCNNLIY